MIAVGRVREIWRYPVKSMRGERLAACEVNPRGLEGDRAFAIYDADGHIGSGKITRRFRPIPALRAHVSRMTKKCVEIASANGEIVYGTDVALSDALGQPVKLAREDAVPHHDAAAIHLLSGASLAWISARVGLSLDAFAFRPNIVFDTEIAWPAEQNWCGKVLAIGPHVRLRITDATERCVMVNISADGSRNERVLQIIARENDSCLGVYADVVETGVISAGDTLTIHA